MKTEDHNEQPNNDGQLPFARFINPERLATTPEVPACLTDEQFEENRRTLQRLREQYGS